jgi:hypothetical protein
LRIIRVRCRRKAGTSVSAVFNTFKWRRAVGLIAAYAFVLQAFLAVSVVTRAAAVDPAHAGIAFILCATNDPGAASGEAGAPVKSDAHCPICILAASAGGALPDAIILPVWQRADARPLYVTATSLIAIHPARAGLSRAPPHDA